MRPPREFLIFRLWGPTASWGEIAVGERRGSWSRPSRSAILGLVGAALGLDRRDSAAHRLLEEQLGFAVRVDDPGKPLRDYHTVQSPSQRKGLRWATRRDELGDRSNLNTILSERGYYTQMDAVVALWARDGAQARPLSQIAERLIEPVFTLYLGRKSCPLGLPLGPDAKALIFTAETLPEALAAYDGAAQETTSELAEFACGPQPTVWIGEKDAIDLGLIREDRLRQRVQRRDGVRDRGRWLFDDRAEVEVQVTENAP